ncbi:MAG: hypothetical protein FIB04_11295 [Gammaproteobacteria bacterium]|nr:hypothetical protein [Gammaproteobacteria bacterium]
MAGRFSRSFELARASWSVVRADKELMLLPVMSVIAMIVVVGSFAVPVVALGGFLDGSVRAEPGPAEWVVALAFYVLTYFVGIFFNTALVGAAMIRMDGGNPTVGDGLRIAWQRVGRIFGYACIAATVGMLLRALEERVGWLGRLIVKLIGVGWALASFLVVPVLVTRDVGPVEAVKESAGLLRETWGENIIGNVGLGLVFAVAYLVLIAAFVVVLVLAAQANVPALAAIVVVAGVVALLALAALQATMQGIYAAALYRFATHQGAPVAGFSTDVMQAAFRGK